MICPNCNAPIGEHVTDYGDHACPSCGLAGPREVLEALAKLRTGLEEISAIRDSIVAYQNIGWSAHVYPLVAALGKAGFSGLGYDKARELARTQVDLILQLEAEIERLKSPAVILAEAERLLRERGAYQMILRVRGGGVSLRRMKLRANANYSGPTLPEAYVRMGAGNG